jgi:hypothetical protein
MSFEGSEGGRTADTDSKNNSKNRELINKEITN